MTRHGQVRMLSKTGARGLGAAAAVAFAAAAGACSQPRVVQLYPQVSEYDGRRIASLSFENPAPFTPDSLADLTETEATHCALVPGLLPFCFPGTSWGLRVHRLQARTLGEDLSRLASLYRQNGYFGTRVVPEIEEVEDNGPIQLRLVVERGDGIVLDSVTIEGTEGIASPDSLEGVIPLKEGQLFDLVELAASADTVVEALRARGHAYAQVLRNYGVDTVQDRATVQLLAVPGPRVVVDSVLIDGMEQLERPYVMRQLAFGPSDLLRLSELRISQRNLYDVELIRFASVSVAADSLQLTPEDSTTATVRVALAEAPEHVITADAGLGTVECGRLRVEWSDRSVFGGGGRRLRLTGAVSRIGLGQPVQFLETSLCSQGRDTLLATQLDYRLAAELTQPYFLNPRNEILVETYLERQSEPGLFQRTARGGQFQLAHQLGARELLTGAVSVEWRRTQAASLLYCFEFRVCGDEDINPFREGLWRNGLQLTWVRDRGNRVVNPTDGYSLRFGSTWSTPVLLSDYDFLRATGQAAVYEPVGRGIVLAGFARIGTFLTRASLGPADFIPPEERFFAGGATSVRGYDRFGLGPGLYLVGGGEPRDPDEVVVDEDLPVDFFPTGGASLAVASVEARFPSPFLRDLVRLAVFADGGMIGLDRIWTMDASWRVTPGAGARIQTPVGPIRVDLGYNPYSDPAGPLYVNDIDTDELVRIDDSFEPPSRAWHDLSRLRLHIAVGQAF